MKKHENDNQKAIDTELIKSIEELIRSGDISEAKRLIESIHDAGNNIELMSLKAIIAMLEGNLDEAELLLERGLQTDSDNVEILCNYAYLLNIKNKKGLSMVLYKRALELTDDEAIIQEIHQNIAGFNKTQAKNHKASIVILTYNNLEYTKLCIESIVKHTADDSYEIIVVDNNSTDGTVEWLKQQDFKVIFNEKNMGFPKGCNQGIEIASGDCILLLNNDTIVTPNWLDNLFKCLYSSDDIGAVGSVTNSCSNYQAIPCSYKTITEMIEFAKGYNISDPSKWEERLRLIGYCMLIKREVIEKIGLLDEIFTPGNFEDDDYSYRIRQAGYRLMLCKDTFIHHFGSISFGKQNDKFASLIKTNRQKFIDKWGADPYNYADFPKDVSTYIKELLRNNNAQQINLLHVNCKSGALLLDIKNEFPAINLYGIEEQRELVVNTNHFACIETGLKCSELIKGYPEKAFDIVLVSLHSNEIQDLSYLEYVLKLVKSAGALYVTFNKTDVDIQKDIMNRLTEYLPFEYSVKNLNSNVVICFNASAEHKIQKTSSEPILDKRPIHGLIENNLVYKPEDKDYWQFILRRIENGIDKEANMEVVFGSLQKNDITQEELSGYIDRHCANKIEIYNHIAIKCFKRCKPGMELFFLKKAFEINPDDADTVYNLCYMLHQYKEDELAINILEDFNPKGEDMQKLLSLIKGEQR